MFTRSSIKKILILFFVINFIAAIYYFVSLKLNGYLPSPFFYDKSDTFGDLYNSLFWATRKGVYLEYHAIYPPLVYLLLKWIILAVGGSDFISSSILREHSVYISYAYLLVYLIVPLVVLRAKDWIFLSFSEKFLIYFIFILSPPALFALERGNIIILMPLFLSIIFCQKGFYKFLTLALMINFKPYFSIYLISDLVKKDLESLFIIIFLSALVFFISGFLFGNNYNLFFNNILNFTANKSALPVHELMAMPSTISAFSNLIHSKAIGIFLINHIPYVFIGLIYYLVEIFKWVCLLLAAIILFKNGAFVSRGEILALLTVLISNLGIGVGGYTMILYYVLIPVFLKMRFKITYFLLISIIAMPIDLIRLVSQDLGEHYSYLSHSFVNVHWNLGLGSLVRPLINLTLLMVLSFEFFTRYNFFTHHNLNSK